MASLLDLTVQGDVGTITDKLAETLPAAAVLVPPGRVVAKALARHDRR